jgi:hypothetical protein
MKVLMKQLREIQENFQSYLQNDDNAIHKHIASSTAELATKRLYLYKDAYYLRLTDTLEKEYPGVRSLIGEDDFYELASLYIEQKPSKHFSVNVFGHGMQLFLKQTEPYAKRPELAEMALFERTLSSAIHQLTAPVLSQEAFGKLPQEKWPELKIVPHPSAQILKLKYNIPEIWLAVSEKKPLPNLVCGKTTHWLVWQKELLTYYIALNQQEAFTLEAFKENRCIAEICEGLCRWVDEAEIPTYLVNLILRWLNDQLLSQFNLE